MSLRRQTVLPHYFMTFQETHWARQIVRAGVKRAHPWLRLPPPVAPFDAWAAAYAWRWRP